MKIVKALAILSFFSVLFGSCFDPPEYPSVPQIEFQRVSFYDGQVTDSLILFLNFKDGDGDIGLSSQNLSHISNPFHPRFFFQENNGKLDTIDTKAVTTAQDTLEVLEINNPNGKLIFPRTRNKTGYGFLPAFAGSCDYEYLTTKGVLIDAAHVAVLDNPTKQITDTLKSLTNTYYRIRDTLYVKPNPNHNNIEVQFLIKDPGNPNADDKGFVLFDWQKEYCQTFDKRFPVLSDRENALEGTLRYGMYSTGFKSLFALKTLKLRIQIKDRALNKSNIIESPEFNLL